MIPTPTKWSIFFRKFHLLILISAILPYELSAKSHQGLLLLLRVILESHSCSYYHPRAQAVIGRVVDFTQFFMWIRIRWVADSVGSPEVERKKALKHNRLLLIRWKYWRLAVFLKCRPRKCRELFWPSSGSSSVNKTTIAPGPTQFSTRKIYLKIC